MPKMSGGKPSLRKGSVRNPSAGKPRSRAMQGTPGSSSHPPGNIHIPRWRQAKKRSLMSVS
jgi:hypothetical protein